MTQPVNHQNQIEELNTFVLTRLAPSPIHGIGVFALRDIPKGSHLFTDMMPRMYNLPYKKFKELRPEVAELLLEQWPQVVNGSIFAWPTTRIQAYMNHSDDPNYNAELDMTTRDITAGEEITENYNAIQNADKIYPWLKAVNTQRNQKKK
jgi:SET domain-containing protein